jgi:hypothetical protein
MNNTKLPFDYFAALTMSGWRDNFRWMLSEDYAETLCEDIDKRINIYAKGLASDRKKQNLFLLALPILRNRIIELQFAALTVQAAEKENIDLVSSLNEVNYLKTGDERYLTSHVGFGLLEKGIKWLFLRRLLRTLTWTPWWKLPWVLLDPEILAVTHNDTLRRKAWLAKKRVYFYQAGLLFKKAKAAYKRQSLSSGVELMCEEIFALLVNKNLFTEIYFNRLKSLAAAFINEHLSTSFHDLEAFYQYKQLPDAVWIGSGGVYASRAIALAVLDCGGKVMSFAHATGTVLTPDYDLLEMVELSVTSEFVDLTPAAAERINRHYSSADRAAFHDFNISGIDGSPQYKKCVAKANAAARNNKRPTVVFTPTETTLYKGPILASNMVYLDWQLRLVKLLQEMDIDLICQPHPEGVFRDRRLIHPLREAFNIPLRKFEEIIDRADVFLVDYIHSTIFGEMLASDIPIVRLALNDNSVNGIHADLKPLLDKRCRTVPVTFDENNLPRIDKDQLEYALLHNWREKVDSRVFKELLLG